MGDYNCQGKGLRRRAVLTGRDRDQHRGRSPPAPCQFPALFVGISLHIVRDRTLKNANFAVNCQLFLS